MKQYTQIYLENRDTVHANSCPVMNALRDNACALLENASLPRKGDEDHEATDIAAQYAPDYGINLRRIDFNIDAAHTFQCDVPNMSTQKIYYFNDIPHLAQFSAAAPIVMTIAEACEKHPEIVVENYGKIAPADDAQIALSNMLAQDGIFIYVPDNTVVEKPLQLVNILNANMPLLVFRRLLIVMGRNSRASVLVCDHTQEHNHDFLISQVCEIVAGEGSHLEIYDIEESSPRTHRIAHIHARQEAHSSLLIDGITLHNGFTRNNYHIDVNGEGCDTRLLGMVIADENRHIDNHTIIAHNAPHCQSNELMKYVLTDNATGAFSGKIFVAPNCPRVEAYQSNKNICASPTAKMHTKPQLIIHTDDVKCSHGAAIGQLDDNALFYMRSRGIPEKEAKVMLMQAFMADAIDAVAMPTLKDRLRHLVEKRLSGADSCADCKLK